MIQNFIQRCEAILQKRERKIAGELENDEKLDYVGDAPDLLNKIVGQLREEGKWDDNAYRQECKKSFTICCRRKIRLH